MSVIDLRLKPATLAHYNLPNILYPISLAAFDMALCRAVGECASFAFNGSSTMMMSAPRPVSVAPTEVASRYPARCLGIWWI